MHQTGPSDEGNSTICGCSEGKKQRHLNQADKQSGGGSLCCHAIPESIQSKLSVTFGDKDVSTVSTTAVGVWQEEGVSYCLLPPCNWKFQEAGEKAVCKGSEPVLFGRCAESSWRIDCITSNSLSLSLYVSLSRSVSVSPSLYVEKFLETIRIFSNINKTAAVHTQCCKGLKVIYNNY